MIEEDIISFQILIWSKFPKVNWSKWPKIWSNMIENEYIYIHMYTENKYDRINHPLIDSKHGATFTRKKSIKRKVVSFLQGLSLGWILSCSENCQRRTVLTLPSCFLHSVNGEITGRPIGSAPEMRNVFAAAEIKDFADEWLTLSFFYFLSCVLKTKDVFI